MTVTKTKKQLKVDGPLSVLYSCRIRLDDEQREKLREAHRTFRQQFAPEVKPSVMAGSTVTVETAFSAPPSTYQEFGLSDLVVSDLIGTRDSIALTTIVQLQKLLGVEIITRKELNEKFENYLDFILS